MKYAIVVFAAPDPEKPITQPLGPPVQRAEANSERELAEVLETLWGDALPEGWAILVLHVVQ